MDDRGVLDILPRSRERGLSSRVLAARLGVPLRTFMKGVEELRENYIPVANDSKRYWLGLTAEDMEITEAQYAKKTFTMIRHYRRLRHIRYRLTKPEQIKMRLEA